LKRAYAIDDHMFPIHYMQRGARISS